MNDLIFSVILISYNNIEYITEALDSIYCQTYPNIQLIISDDASKDFNRKIIDDYIKNHSSQNIKEVIVNINEQNLGTVKHLENIYKICTGELITIIAADDAFADKFALEKLAEEYLKYDKKYRVITSLLMMCGQELTDRKAIFTSKEDVDLINSGDTATLFGELAYRCIAPSSGTAVEASVYKDIGTLSDDYTFVEDWSSHTRMARMGIQLRCVEYITVLHRDGGISHGNTRAASASYLKYYHDLLTIYTKEVEPYLDKMPYAVAQRATKNYKMRQKRYAMDLQKFTSENLPSSDRKKIVFYFRKNVLAQGDFSLYYPIADYFANNYDCDVYCVNNNFGAVQMKYLDSKINFCVINKENIKKFKGATFVTAFNQVFFLMEELCGLKDAKIMLLFLHPQIIQWFSLQVPKKFDLNGLLKLLYDKNAYGFMDDSNYWALKEYTDLEFKKRYFPVTINSSKIKPYVPLHILNSDRYNVGWLGRMDGDKIFSATNLLDNLNEVDGNIPFDCHFVGDGNAKQQIKIEQYAPRMRFAFTSCLYGEQKDEYFKQNVDVALAMGISALDIASLGIPTIIPIISSKKFNADKFVYIYETEGYSLGWSETDLKSLGLTTHTAEEIIKDIYDDDKKEEIGRKCYEFTKETFSLENRVESMYNLINETTLTLSDLYGLADVKKQMRVLKTYKSVRHNRNYAGYLQFRQKLEKFKKNNIVNKFKILLRWSISLLKGDKR